MSIVLLQLMGLDPLVATLLEDMNFMVIWTDGNFCRREANKLEVNKVDFKLANKSDRFLVSVDSKLGLLSV